MSSSARETSSCSVQQTGSRVIHPSIQVDEGFLLAAITCRQRSRSVTTPTSVGVKGSWMTGRIPVSVSCISRAAERVELDGKQHTVFLVMISVTFIKASPNREQAKQVRA